jgi:uncharacterized protein (TIRG00374 family)
VTALAIGLLAVFLRNADLARVWAEMNRARADLLVAALALVFVMYAVRAERWQYLLEPLGHTRFMVAFRTTVIGFATSSVLPARAGELLRPYLLARQEQLPATAVFATIIVERLLDLVAVLLLIGAFFLFLQTGEAVAAPALFETVWWGALITVPIGVGILVLMFVMAGHPERLHGLTLRVVRLLPQRMAGAVAGFARTFAEGLAVVRRPTRLACALAWSLVLWLAIALQVWVIVGALGIALPFSGSFLLTAMLVVGVAVPTPGGIGGTHAVLRLGLTSFYGAENNAAVATAIVHHALNFVPILVLGFWFLARDGLNMARLRELSASARTPPTELRRDESASARTTTVEQQRESGAIDGPKPREVVS